MEDGDFDNALNVFSPDGKLLQLDHAQKSSEQSKALIFVNNGKSIVIFTEKKNNQAMVNEQIIQTVNDSIKNNENIPLVINLNEPIEKYRSQIDELFTFNDSKKINRSPNATDHSIPLEIKESYPIFMCTAGLRPDALYILKEARFICKNWSYTNLKEITTSILSKELANYLHDYTISDRFRPFGTKILMFGLEKDILSKEVKMRSFIISCDGNFNELLAGSIGNKEEEITTFLEQNYNYSMNDQEMVTICYETIKNTVQNDTEKLQGFIINNTVEEIPLT
ncbi:20S proteasome, regulatory subunit alpha type PSMA7/PRE6 [Pseudoloma neurophilia]|uniref:Proteasome subunit alpha type n=1 Tax=Pseudoloma neurophilia TaxID=146866 RepID=A0A0R0M128_9MICR|nr:20S proteasome, regulatory subunit alpha type PSMA7/PRE6 [Pseudoloma neurophilia]